MGKENTIAHSKGPGKKQPPLRTVAHTGDYSEGKVILLGTAKKPESKMP
jgi:hypothetical protein